MAEPPNNKPTVVALQNFRLYTRHPERENINVSLSLGYRGDYPRLMLNVLDKTLSPREKYFNAPFDNLNFLSLLSRMKTVASSTKPIRIQVKCFNSEWKDRKIVPNSKVEVASVIIGKDEEGVCYIIFKPANIPLSFTFYILSADWHTWVFDDQPATKSQVSGTQLKVFAEATESIYHYVLSMKAIGNPQFSTNLDEAVNDSVTPNIQTVTVDYDDDIPI